MTARVRRFLVAASLILIAAIGHAPRAAAQGSGPVKNSPSNPCAFDAGLGRSGRCAGAGDTVSWVVHADNPLGTDTVFGVYDTALSPAGCATFICPPVLSVNGMPVPLPPGATCDPATGFDIRGFTVPGFGWFDVTFQTTLSATLSSGDSCANLATIVYPWGDVPAVEPVSACSRDVGGGVYPTIIDICGGSTGTPSFALIKTAESSAGSPVADIDDGARVCYRYRIENTGTASGTVDFQDAFDAHLSALDFDPLDPFATGSCGWAGNTVGCGGIVVGPGGTDEARICGTFTCTNGQVDLCNAAVLTVQDPPTGTLVPSRACASCGTGPTCLPVLAPDFSSSTKTAALTDADRNGCVSLGDTVTFTFTAINGGTDVASSVAFFDADPPGGVDAGTCTWSVGGGAFQPCPATPAIGWSLGAMAPSDPAIVIRWGVTITAPPAAGAWCDQSGTLSTPECATTRVMGDTCLPGCASGPEVSAGIACLPQTVQPGEEVAIRVAICNQSGVPATRVRFVNPIPPCAAYVPGTLAMAASASAPVPMTDAADGDAAAFDAGRAELMFDVQAFLGRALAPGECVDALFRLVAQTCADVGFFDQGTLSADNMTTRPTSSCFVSIVAPRPDPVFTKFATPDPDVAPGHLIAYTLRLCNQASASADLLDAVITDDVPACVTYEPGSLRVDGRRMTDAPGDDDAELAPTGPPADTVTFRIARLAPGECADVTWQARASLACGGMFVSNSALFNATGVSGPLASNTVTTAIATYSLVKTASDADGGRLVPGDEIEYAIEFCSASPRDLLQVDVTDLIPTLGGDPPSDCPVTYVPESISIQIDGQAEQPLTDQILDDLGRFEPGPPAFIEVIASPLPPATCFVVRFRVRLDGSCVTGECIGNRAHATYTTPLEEIDSNVATACTGALLSGQLMRDVGRASLTPTRGCEFGPRLLEFACSEIPGICVEDAPGTRWTLLRDALFGTAPLAFYEFPGNGCCVATPPDGTRLMVRKDANGADVVVEMVAGCR